MRWVLDHLLAGLRVEHMDDTIEDNPFGNLKRPGIQLTDESPGLKLSGPIQTRNQIRNV